MVVYYLGFTALPLPTISQCSDVMGIIEMELTWCTGPLAISSTVELCPHILQINCGMEFTVLRSSFWMEVHIPH